MWILWHITLIDKRPLKLLIANIIKKKKGIEWVTTSHICDLLWRNREQVARHKYLISPVQFLESIWPTYPLHSTRQNVDRKHITNTDTHKLVKKSSLPLAKVMIFQTLLNIVYIILHNEKQTHLLLILILNL